MTTFSKILSLITTAACLAFLGFVMVSLIAGPNWEGMTHELDDYVFEYTPGETPTWAASSRDDLQAVGSPSPILPKKIVDVLDDKRQEQDARLDQLENGVDKTQIMGITLMQTSLKKTKADITTDVIALQNFEKKLHQDMADLSAAYQQVTEQVSQKARDAEVKHRKAEQRRGDIYRLQNLVAVAETDEFRAIEHQKKLRDTWERYQGEIKRLKRRNEQLTQQVDRRTQLQAAQTKPEI